MGGITDPRLLHHSTGHYLSNTTYYYATDGEITQSERAELRINALANIRARAGISLDTDSLVYASAGVGFVSAEFAASTSDTHPETGLMDISKIVPVYGIGYQRRMGGRMSLDLSLNQYDVSNDKFIGSFGDGGTTDSSINFKAVTTVNLGLSFDL